VARGAARWAPAGLFSTLVGMSARAPVPRALRRPLLGAFARAVGADLAEAELELGAYGSLGDFFARKLRGGARVVDAEPDAIVSPCDGLVAAAGTVDDGTLIQAKGKTFSLGRLLADEDVAEQLLGGSYAVIYLSPRDYHRVHMPWTGTLRETVHVPGRLFSVGTDAVANVPRLFARNERLVCHFDTDFGPMVSVMVGALLVSGVETVWSGEEIPAYGTAITRKDYRGKGVTLERFAEMARFNYGSTVIVLLPPGVAGLAPELKAESPVRLGQALARLGR
jgi:phosphatidylserine decarboxylase